MRNRNAPPDAVVDRPTQGLTLAVEDLRALVGHVSALLNHAAMAGSEIPRWLSDLDDVLCMIRSAISEGRMLRSDDLTIDDEGPADLEAVLGQRPAVDDSDWPETAQSALLVTLIDYWLDQVNAHAYALVHLLIGADDLLEAADSLTKLNGIRYPLG